MLVHRSARRRGIGAALMGAVEDRARADGRWLLILDTVTGQRRRGDVPSTWLDRARGHAEPRPLPDGTPAATTFFWKDLR